MKIELDINDFWYDVTVSDVAASGFRSGRVGHIDNWLPDEEPELSYTIDSIEHGTEEGGTVFMNDDQISAFIEANGDAIDAAVWKALK